MEKLPEGNGKRADLERKEREQQENVGQEGGMETRGWKAGRVQRREQEENLAEAAFWVKDLVKG